jgi:diguanylate cyclase (GGDEF)-like protein
MSIDSLAARARGGYPSATPALAARDAGADLELRRHLLWAAPAGAGFATLAAAAGGAFGDRPTILGALVLVAAVTVAPLLFRGLVSRIRARLDGVVSEREALRAELDAAHRTKEELRNLAYHDDLTGLPNRSLLYDRLGVAITHAHRQSTHVALLFLDLDDFKTVNDRFGHGFGDRLLVELATRVRGSVRAGDTVARFGGDEFVVLLNGVSGPGSAAQVAGKVLDAVRAPFRFEGSEVTIGASVGMSVYPEDGTSSDELVGSADAAMYRDKQREMQRHERSGIR